MPDNTDPNDDRDAQPADLHHRVDQLEAVVEQQNETIRDMLPSRRGVLAGAAGAAGLASLSGSASASIGGGPNSDAMAENRVPYYRVPESDLDSPGVVGRRVEITEGGADYEAGDQLVDTGQSWELIDSNYGSVKAEQSNTVADFLIYNDDGTYVAISSTNRSQKFTDTGIHRLISSILTSEGNDVCIVIGPSEFTYDQTLSINDSNGTTFPTIRGSGVEKTLIKRAAGTNGPAIELGPISNQSLWFQLEDLQYNGDRGVDSETADGFVVRHETGTGGVTDIHMKSVFWSEFPGNGIVLEYSHGHRFENVLCEFCDKDGVSYQVNGGTSTGSSTWFDGCYLAINDGWGLNMSESEGSIRRAKFDIETSGNGLGGANIQPAGGQINTIRAQIVSRNDNGDGVVVDGDTRHSRVEAVVSDASGFGLVAQADFWNQIVVEGEGNSSGLIDVDANSLDVINGVAQNAGDPSTTGRWNGRSQEAFNRGATIYDSDNAGYYLPLPSAAASDWFEISGTTK